MVRPVDARYPVTLGYRQKPRSRKLRNYIHRGIDYGCPTGTPVVATTDATVVTAGWGGYGPAFGNHVVLKTSNTWHLYGHLSAETVSPGQHVKAGQQIGRSGRTGNVTGAHLHYAEFTQGPAAYQSDRAPRFIDAAGDVTNKPTVFDASHWSQAHYPWFRLPWKPRVPGIGKELRGDEAGTEASVHTFTELYSEETANDILAELRKNGDDFRRAFPAGRVGMELMYDASKWELVSATNYASGIQNRYAYVVYLRRKSTGKVVAFIVGHAPIRSNSDKARWGRWFAGIVSSARGPRLIACDWNRNKDKDSPRKETFALGFRSMRSQAAIANESADEFPSGGWTLAEHYSLPHEARITGGEQDLTAANLGDHRRFESRVVIP